MTSCPEKMKCQYHDDCDKKVTGVIGLPAGNPIYTCNEGFWQWTDKIVPPVGFRWAEANEPHRAIRAETGEVKCPPDQEGSSVGPSQ